MPCTPGLRDEDWDDPLDDREEPDEPDDDDEDDDDHTVACPSCRTLIYEDSERCPRCGHFLTRADAALRPKPWWLVLGAFAALYAMLRWLF